jgi:hypothetical protein
MLFFSEKPFMKPVTVKAPHKKIQIDFMNMGEKFLDQYKGRVYHYILTLMAIFWFYPLTTKSNEKVSKNLRTFFF